MIKKKVGRPRIAKEKKRSFYVCIPCTKDEVKTIERKAKEMQVRKTELMRQALKRI